MNDFSQSKNLSSALSMLLHDSEGSDKVLSELSNLQRDFISMQKMLLEGELSEAKVLSEELLHRSRSQSERDIEIEIRLRIERALISVEDNTKTGQELRWCVDRLNAMIPGSSLHGVALLNLAAWHSNNGEIMMSMAVHSEISKASGHPDEIRALSRLEVSRILVSISDLDPAMRHLWSAREIFLKSNLETEALVTSLEWLDLALNEIEESAPSMRSRIENAKPRESPGSSWVASNPEDIIEVVEHILPYLCKDVSGIDRTDLGLIIDASEALSKYEWIEVLLNKKSQIQDERILDLLQS